MKRIVAAMVGVLTGCAPVERADMVICKAPGGPGTVRAYEAEDAKPLFEEGKPFSPTAKLAALSGIVSDCIRREAYLLAKSDQSTELLAQLAADRCEPLTFRFIDRTIAGPMIQRGYPLPQDLIARAKGEYVAEAKTRVTEGKAGKCWLMPLPPSEKAAT